MSVNKTYFGTAVVVPETDETGWGAEMTGIVEKTIDSLSDTACLLTTSYTAKEESTTSTLAASATLTQTARIHKLTGSGGAVTLSATTAITSGTTDGQKLTLIGNHASNTVTILNGANTQLNGHITLGLYDRLDLHWDSTVGDWLEDGRSS